jgi:methylenetetrahydrofolate reductase (NADPH)
MNKGKYLDHVLENGNKTDFCVGVAGYPEKHMEAPNLEKDIYRLKEKVNAGAEYIVTQMFFDNHKYFQFVDKCRKSGINVPIIPGLKPLATKNQVTIIPHRFHIDLPDQLIHEVEKCKDNKEVHEVGVEWCKQQSKELVEAGVPVLHYYSMGRSTNIQKIAKAIF